MQIKVEKFEGPLDLLLQMIDEEKLDITEVSLANIADQFVEHIQTRSDIDPEELADFLVIATKLLLIKSRTLLPYLVPGDEEEEIEDFANQLKIYKEFLEASRKIEEMLKKKDLMFAKEFNKQLLVGEKFFYPPKNVTKNVLQKAFKEVVSRLKPAEVLPEERIMKAVKVEDKIRKIKALLKKLNKFDFTKLIDGKCVKIDVIISFLAMLEMMKQRAIAVEQRGLFSGIKITTPQIYPPDR